MRVLISIALILFSVSGEVFAGSEQIIKQRAKDLRDQNNAQQGVVSAQPSRSAAQTTGPAAAPPQATPQQIAFRRFQADMDPIKAGADVTSQQKQKLAADLIALAQGSNKPSQPAAAKLGDELANGLMAQPISASQRARLLQDLEKAMNSSALPDAQVQALAGSIKSVFQLGGVDSKQVARIGDALNAVIVEVRKAPAK